MLQILRRELNFIMLKNYSYIEFLHFVYSKVNQNSNNNFKIFDKK